MTKIQIRKNIHGEYEVPAPTKDEIYYTDDRDDAIGTAAVFHGNDVDCVFRSGSYNSNED